MNRSRVFVLGAGFSKHAGFPLADEMKSPTIDFVRDSVHPEFSAWRKTNRLNEFEAGLAHIDPHHNLRFEDMLQRLEEDSRSMAPCGPCYATLEGLKIATAKVLWEKHAECPELPHAYQNFGRWFRKSDDGMWPAIISFNWDLVAEIAVDRFHAGGEPVHWRYSPDMNNGIPVIKPHGSINFQDHEGVQPLVDRGWIPVTENIVYDGHTPFEDPDRSEILNLRYMLFPGEKVDETGNPDHDELWSHAAAVTEPRATVVFIGYSLPDYDQYAIARLKGLVRGKYIEAINPSEADLQKYRTTFGDHVIREAKRFEDSRYALEDPIYRTER